MCTHHNSNENRRKQLTRYPSSVPSISCPSSVKMAGRIPKKGNVWQTHFEKLKHTETKEKRETDWEIMREREERERKIVTVKRGREGEKERKRERERERERERRRQRTQNFIKRETDRQTDRQRQREGVTRVRHKEHIQEKEKIHSKRERPFTFRFIIHLFKQWNPNYADSRKGDVYVCACVCVCVVGG